ncbi:Sugar isomerase (SIS) family protein [Thalictrum thalictroides]|uniref:Transcription initiation factor IIF subunit alpha n=1 Tax=Thalictrum thalictroides TaxID=46969 RepID=A0A7J6UY38_THATH|nr:Sugar isomerase (SIS) family protein [Thalictrum thalictroides]
MSKFSKSDLLVLFSKSGDEEELLKLVCCAKTKDILLISVTFGETNLLKFLCDLHVDLPLEKETTCSLNLDLVIQMVFCDSVANALMGARNLRNDPALGIDNKGLLQKKRKSDSVDVKASFGALAKKIKTETTSKSSEKDGFPLAASVCPVTEDEIRAVLLQKFPVATNDLVAKFTARLKSSKAKSAFADLLKKISKFRMTNGSTLLSCGKRDMTINEGYSVDN